MRQSRQSTRRKQIINLPYSERLAVNLEILAKELDLPLKVLHKWRQREVASRLEGWLSYPVTREDFRTLLIIRNYVWGVEDLLRAQLAKLSESRRYKTCVTAKMTWIENVVFLHLLRRYCLGERNFRLKQIRNDISVRYPNGVNQLTQKIFSKVKRSVYDRVRRVKAKQCITEYLALLRMVGLDLDIDGCVIDAQKTINTMN